MKGTWRIVASAGIAVTLAWIPAAVLAASAALTAAPRAAAPTAAAPNVAAPSPTRVPQSWTDFNDDGRADLAIGVPGDHIAGIDNAGSVHVFYSASAGLSGSRSERWHENTPREGGGTIGQAEDGDRFGSAVAAGDFNGDGFGDLAIGVSGEDVLVASVNRQDRGAIHVLWGSADGLVADTPAGIQGAADNGRLGLGLVALDYYNADGEHGKDGTADLAIGQPGMGHGRVIILRIPSDVFPAINPDPIETHECFSNGVIHFDDCGEIMAAGNLDGIGGDDLVLGVPRTDTGPDGPNRKDDAGAVVLLQQGEPSTVTQESSNVPGSSVENDRFGQAVAVGELFPDHSGEELLVGVPGKEVVVGGVTIQNAGRVIFFLGLTVGLDESSADVPDTAEDGDGFGSALAIGDVGGSPANEVIIGVPGEAVGGQDAAGSIDVLYADRPDQRFHQKTTGVLGAPDFADQFGSRLTVGNFGLGGKGDVATTVLNEDVAGVSFPGAVAVFYGTPANGLTANDDQLFSQATAGVAGVPDKGESFGHALR